MSLEMLVGIALTLAHAVVAYCAVCSFRSRATLSLSPYADSDSRPESAGSLL
jgi:hypothetical protein